MVTLSVNDITVNENDGSANFTVTLSAASTQTVSVRWSTLIGTANANGANTDYNGFSNQTLTFSPGQTSKTVSIALVNDAVPEPTESFKLFLESPTNATIARSTGTATVLDTDVAAANQAPTISGPTTVSKNTNQNFTFGSLLGASDSDGSVAQYRFSDSTPGAGFLTLNGSKISGPSVTVNAQNLSTVGYSTGSTAGSNQIAIEAIDNLGLASSPFTTTINVTSGTIATKTGDALVAEARQHLGEEYYWGAFLGKDVYAAPSYTGPWDCAEFVSWTVHKVYGEEIGLRNWDAYTGYWSDDSALGQQVQFISMEHARITPGAIIFKFDNELHHIAISPGNGKIIEANVNFRKGFYWSDNGAAYAPLLNGEPPRNVDIGDVAEPLLDPGVYNAARGWKAVILNDVQDVTSTTTVATQNDDYPDPTPSTSSILNTSVQGKIEAASDTDWFRMDSFAAGHSYRLSVVGNGSTPLSDTFFSIRDSQGNRVVGLASRPGGTAYDDAGGGHDALVDFTAPAAGTYYLVVGAGGPNFATLTGGYSASLADVADPGSTTSTATTIAIDGSVLTVHYIQFGFAEGRH